MDKTRTLTRHPILSFGFFVLSFKSQDNASVLDTSLLDRCLYIVSIENTTSLLKSNTFRHPLRSS